MVALLLENSITYARSWRETVRVKLEPVDHCSPGLALQRNNPRVVVGFNRLARPTGRAEAKL